MASDSPFSLSRYSLITFLVTGSLVVIVSAGSVEQDTQSKPEKPTSVFVLDTLNDGFLFTTAKAGVDFDLDGVGRPQRVGWTTSKSDDGFLFLDVNSNGRVDDGRELLGNGWRKPNGSRVRSADEALHNIQGVYDLPLGDVAPELQHVAYIDSTDDVFARIRLWQDRNHDGRSEDSELAVLSKADISRIYVGFRMRRTADNLGNAKLLEGIFYVSRLGTEIRRDMVLVEFAR